jgi:hypothetical protein
MRVRVALPAPAVGWRGRSSVSVLKGGSRWPLPSCAQGAPRRLRTAGRCGRWPAGPLGFVSLPRMTPTPILCSNPRELCDRRLGSAQQRTGATGPPLPCCAALAQSGSGLAPAAAALGALQERLSRLDASTSDQMSTLAVRCGLLRLNRLSQAARCGGRACSGHRLASHAVSCDVFVRVRVRAATGPVGRHGRAGEQAPRRFSSLHTPLQLRHCPTSLASRTEPKELVAHV